VTSSDTQNSAKVYHCNVGRGVYYLRIILSVWILVVLTGLSTGCDINQSKPIFRVATSQWIGYETLYLAKSLGEYQHHPIKLVQLPAASDVVNALLNRNIEAAALTLGEAISVYDAGLELRIVLVLDFSRGADAIIAGDYISGISSLRGKRIGMEKTAVGFIMLDAALSADGISTADVEIIPFTTDSHMDAFISDQVDAIVTSEPTRTRILNSGKGKVLFDSTKIPDRIVDVLVVRNDIIHQHMDTLDRLIHGHFQAQNYLKQAPRKSAAMIAPRLWISPNHVLEAYNRIHLPDQEENQRLLSGESPTLAVTTNKLVHTMSRFGLLANKPNLSSMLDNHWFVQAR